MVDTHLMISASHGSDSMPYTVADVRSSVKLNTAMGY
jgi:hypothetical protein